MDKGGAETATEADGGTPGIGPQDLLCFNLYAASHAIIRLYQPLLEPLGLTYPQFLVLLALRRGGAMGVGALSHEVMLETNTLSPLLKRMEAAGHVTRTRAAQDERRVQVRLTDSGQALAETARGLPGCIGQRLPSDPDGIAALLAGLVRLRAALDD